MTLSQRQSEFTILVAKLILHAQSLGLRLTLGEAYRSPEEARRLAGEGKGITASLHTQRLAIDLNLFVDGIYQTSGAAYKPLGDWWKAQSTPDLQCCWGGDFTGKTAGDFGHFSVAYLGRK